MKLWLARVAKLRRGLAMAMRLATARLRYGCAVFGGGVRIERGVRVQVTDGARLRVGAKVSIDRNATLIAKHGALSIGPTSYVGIGAVICARANVTIGTGCMIGEYATVRDQDHVASGPEPLPERGFVCSAVEIGDNVWIGAKATITRGLAIGEGAVVGANSVVTRDVSAAAGRSVR